MLNAHELMFGAAGRTAAAMVLKWARCLFAVPIDPLTVRVVLAPVEIGPYNKHQGYHSGDGQSSFILGNRHHCAFCGGQIAIRCEADFEDFIVHELTHRRQTQLLQEHQWPRTRPGAHRDRGWYFAVSEASLNYLGVEIPEYSWPTGPRTRKGTLDEKDMTHWPSSIRALASSGDERLIYYTDVEEDEAA
jgi:hypothetical protein